MLNIKLPVSLGEALDKLTILDIKSEKIKDNRKNDVQKEYDILYKELKEFIQKYQSLYESMKKINLLIWDQMDKIRDGNTSDEDYLILCRKCIDSNDIRFRIKNKINLISNSQLKEQKSYKVNRLLIKLNCNEESIPLFIKPIKYCSFIYDEIIIESSKNIDEIINTFYYDNTIKYNIKLKDIDIKKKFSFEKNNYSVNEIYEIININEKDLELV
jgi:hypothetical protein